MTAKKQLITPIGHPELPEGWLWKRLDETMGDVVDCPHSTPVLADTGPYVVRTQDVRTGVFDSENAAKVSEETYQERIARAEPLAGDLLFSREGTYFGTCALVPKAMKVCLGQRMVLIKANKTSDSTYIKYWINSPPMAAFISGQKDGSVAERINMPWIRALPIAVPPLPIQHQIAAILSTFDDKIELNRQMNRTLEQMARALFKSWFIDFDPVHAKQRGEQPAGMDAETAALFPDRFVEIDGKEVPEGWRSAQLGDIAEIIDCLHSKKPERVENGFPYVQLNNIGNNGEMILSEIYLISEEDYKKWTSRIEIREGDCVITNVGRVGAVCRIPKGFTGAIGRNMTAIRLKESFGSFSAFCIQLLTSEKMRSEINDNTDSGTILNALNVKNIPKLKFIMADKKVVEASNAILSLMRDRIEHNLKEIDRLSQVRDSLLPRLLSGELDVSDWENAVEDPEGAPA